MKKVFSIFTAAVLCVLTFLSAVAIQKFGEPAKAIGTTEYTIEDVKNLQNFLIGKETLDLSNKDYDLYKDGVWNVFDLCLMKRYVLNSMNKNKEIKMKLTVNGQELTATLYDNATARAFAEHQYGFFCCY
ncbi:MAG: hypothetical protein NC320_11760 [Clostridium sp.]|nr:hypothetical protein [Clostridium sp.]